MLLARGILPIFHSHHVPRRSNSSLFLLTEISFPLIPLMAFRAGDPFGAPGHRANSKACPTRHSTASRHWRKHLRGSKRMQQVTLHLTGTCCQRDDMCSMPCRSPSWDCIIFRFFPAPNPRQINSFGVVRNASRFGIPDAMLQTVKEGGMAAGQMAASVTSIP